MIKMQDVTYAFWNPIRNVDVEKRTVEYFENPTHIVVGPHRYSNGVSVKSTNPVDAFVEAGFLEESDEKMRRGSWLFEDFKTAKQVGDIETIKQLTDIIEPPKEERFFIPRYKKGKKLDKYSVCLDGFKDCVGGLTRKQTEVLAGDVSKETGQNYVPLTLQGFYDGSAKGGSIRKEMELGWAHLLHGFVKNNSVSTGWATVDGGGLRDGDSDRPSRGACAGFAVLEKMPLPHELLEKEQAELIQIAEKKRAEWNSKKTKRLSLMSEIDERYKQLFSS